MAVATATVTVQKTSAPTAPSVPVKGNNECCSYLGRAWKIYTNAMEEGGSFFKSIFRLTNATTFWSKFFNPATPQSVTNVGQFSKQAKNLVSIIGLPATIERVWNRVVGFDASQPVKSAVDLGADVCSLANSGCDTAEFVSEVATPLPKEVMSQVKAVNYTATFLGALKGTYDTAWDVIKNVFTLRSNEADKVEGKSSDAKYETLKNRATKELVGNVLSVASKASYLALGAFGIASLFTPVAPAIIVGCLTVGTVLGLGHFFYDRVVDPKDKHAASLTKHYAFPRAVEIDQEAKAKKAS